MLKIAFRHPEIIEKEREYLLNNSVFSYFKDLLTRHKLLSAEFLEQHYDRVCIFISLL